MSQPAVSVVIPVYGVEKYIENCLRSLLAQTFRNFELILVDDGCLDTSVEIARRVLVDAPMPVHILQQENQGQGAARDYGIREAAGEYIICVDSDDTVAPTFLETLYALAQQEQSDVSFCLFRMVGEKEIFQFRKGTGGYHSIPRHEMLQKFLYRTLVPILPSMMIRRQMILNHGLQAKAGCRFSEDVHLMWQIFDAAEAIAYTEAPLYNYLIHANSTMSGSSQERILSGYAAFCELTARANFLADFNERQLVLPRWVLGALNASAMMGDYRMFMDTAAKMDYRRQISQLCAFPEKKAQILALMLLYLPRVYYSIMQQRMKLL